MRRPLKEGERSLSRTVQSLQHVVGGRGGTKNVKPGSIQFDLELAAAERGAG